MTGARWAGESAGDLRRELATGAGAGLALGGVLAGVTIASGWPPWSEVVWSIALAGLAVVAAAVLVRATQHAALRWAVRGPVPPPDLAFALRATALLTALAGLLVAAVVVLELTWWLGHDQVWPYT